MGLCALCLLPLAVLRRHTPEQALLLTMAAAAVVLARLLSLAAPLLERVEALFAQAGVEADHVAILLRTVAAALVSRLCGDLCRDSGSQTLGTVVELTRSERLYEKPLHPYTQALLSAIPIPDPEVERKRQRIELEGDIPSPIDPPPGCRFAGRCRMACDRCRQESPALRELEPGHFVACHLV